ncbi:Cmr2p KNAG_0H03290 [Huiozyma naganishii CBS 8797]|uniref:DMAP1-binding domain-containing protein n=1 Tax=Huiozyma naganishii (strain ATCC MYA-139 / BCRC 22969 / CBS 8797 / KCTC 17520 / NBRC 10181 / NCYC 3082 / Yp74L-3) TaxID=1071383 RepID=J7S8U3_HUIN7|nr:hypothetical protein KNAG_0H03290 [Kazachstania naganishii CBS 8797]CCK71744.1 hypothetical protein KNAG_0H03290 [Kazachstania naganishii CBS 8797]
MPTLDFSIPPSLPVDVQEKLNELIQDYRDESLTVKGYEKKRAWILDRYQEKMGQKLMRSATNVDKRKNIHIPGRNQSLSSTLINKNLISPRSSVNRNSLNDPPSLKSPRKIGTTSEYADSPHSIYQVTTNSNKMFSDLSSSGDLFRTPTRQNAKSNGRNTSSVQLSLPSHDVLDDNQEYIPMIPLLPRVTNIDHAEFSPNQSSLLSILRGRFEHQESQTAMIAINSKGKETFITWDKLYLRAEKVAHELGKSKLYKMDKVLLWYNKSESVTFIVALLGCFIAGMVAVPISFETYSLAEIMEIIKSTNTKTILISNECHKQLDSLHSTTTNTKVKLNRNELFRDISFLRTDDLGTYSKAKKQSPTFEVPNIAYIEFTRTPLGRLSGVVMKHNILIEQFNAMADILNSKKMPYWKKTNIRKPFNRRVPLTIATKESNAKFMILNTLDPTRSTGLVLGVLFNIFSGNVFVTVDNKLITKSGGYENLIDRYRADILLNDQLQLKQIVINYLENPLVLAERRKHKFDFTCIKCCLTTCTTIDTDVTEMVVHKWLKNLGCIDAPLCYSPVLTLIDFGGIFVATKDKLGGLDNFPIHNSKLRLQDELYVNKQKLRANTVEPSITAMLNSSASFKDYIKLETFGFPMSNTMLCVVNPDDATLVPDLCVGEIWLSSDNLVDEFFQMEKVNEFVFKAKLNYAKMFTFINESKTSKSTELPKERLQTILNVCPGGTQFVRTKLMGFVHNGKIFILSLIEDMFLQNQLIRLPNWSHTSDVSRAVPSSSTTKKNVSDCKTVKSSESSNISISDRVSISNQKGKRVVETHYLQQITETLVRTVATVSDVSAFEINRHKEEHILVMVIESSLAKKRSPESVNADMSIVSTTVKQKEDLEKKMNELIDQIYRILWIFHKIQPMCIVVVPRGSLPRRYCSLELANSTVERKFVMGELDSKFVKFQFDNIILDFIPHSGYYNESIFSEHLSRLRRAYIEDMDSYYGQYGSELPLKWQTSGIDYRDTSYDLRTTNKQLSDFENILELIEWRVKKLPNEAAFTDGSDASSTSSNNNDNNIHKNVSWKTFDQIVGACLKKIISSKTPLKPGDKVVIMCKNSVDYVAIVMACLYCHMVIIPLEPITEATAEEDLQLFSQIVKGYRVKRIFIDGSSNNLLMNNNTVSRHFKSIRNTMPKITVVSKLKRKHGVNIALFKNILKLKYSCKVASKANSLPCMIWINQDHSITNKLHIKMNHSALMNFCKITKETLQLPTTSPIFSLCNYTTGFGFMLSCFIGPYVGTTTHLFDVEEFLSAPKAFLLGIQNLNARDLYFTLGMFHRVLERASSVLVNGSKDVASNKSKNLHKNTSKLIPYFFRNVKNIMITFVGRPSFLSIENLLARYQKVVVSPYQINFVYQHHFNPIVSLRSYLDIPPIDVYLDPVSLREGVIREVDPTSSRVYNALRLQDSGVVPVCTDVTIVNPETLLPCLEGEIGEIWCCSEANVHDYVLFNANGQLSKDKFITEQFQSKFNKEVANGLTYLRTGDLGFIRNIQSTNREGDLISLNLLYVLGSINETVDILGLTHFVTNLEKTVRDAHPSIMNCVISKAGGLLVCLIQCRNGKVERHGNLTALVVAALMSSHGVILDLVSFVKFDQNGVCKKNWNVNRHNIMESWFDQELRIESQFAVNYGENISIYLLSDFEKDT